VGAIDAELLGRVDLARGDVPRTRFVERALEAALTDGGRSATGGGVRPSAPEPEGSAPPRAPGPRSVVREGAPMTELPKIARRHWADG
jgi:hypothetical protein